MNSETLAEELRVPGDLDRHAVTRQSPGAGGQAGGGAHRDGGLADDHRRSRQPRDEVVDHRVDVAKVRPVLALLLWCSHAQEVDVGEVGGQVVVGGELQPTGSEVVAQDLRQTGFVERDVAAGEFGDLAGVDVDADDLMTQLCHPGGVCCAEVAGTEHGASHALSVISADDLIG